MNSNDLLLSKENIQPLRHGRDTSKLSAGLHAQTDKECERMLQKQRHEYETQLRDETIADPMAVWYDYINWLEQSFPSQTHKINVVLKKCINKFKANDTYQNDERFVKLCLKYATMNEGTSDTFGLLYSHGIGVKCAVFYIAWAELYAVTESFKKAAKIYEKGINNLAEPLEMLKAAEKKFHAFLVKKMLDSGETFQPTPGVYETAPVRQAYNKLRPISVANGEVIPSVRVGANVATAGKLPAATKPTGKTNGAFAIYQDADEDGIDVKPTAKLHKIKGSAATTKENHKKAGKWTYPDSAPVPFTVPAVPLPFQVHVDDDALASQDQPKMAQLTTALKPKQPSDEFNVDFSNTPLFWAEPYDPKMRPMYRKEQVYAGGLEFQFEELRAMKYRRRIESAKTDSSLALPIIATPSVPEPREVTATPLAALTSKCEPPAVAPEREESVKKTGGDTGAKPRVVNGSGRKSVKTGSARRRIAVGGDEVDKRGSHSARKSSVSNFAGVVRRTLVLDPRDSASVPKQDLPSESFINQTIHTKEAVNEMQELWFAKPATPPQEQPKSAFAFYVDESCLGKEAEAAVSVSDRRPLADAHADLATSIRKQPPCLPQSTLLEPIDDQNKENAIPVNYAGATGKSTRPVTGILTLADNVPFEPIQEDEDDVPDEEDMGDSMPEAPGNTTGITETWNFTQAFSFPKLIHASTPNVRRSMYRQPPSDEAEQATEASSYPETRETGECAMDLKKSSAPKSWAGEAEDLTQKDLSERSDVKKRVAYAEQRTLVEPGVKNLSIIVETSREYKSSSSGSGASACSKLQPFTPGESRIEAHHKRVYSYSQAEESRKTPFASKTQSTYGYEASAELSCTDPKAVTDCPSYAAPKTLSQRQSLCFAKSSIDELRRKDETWRRSCLETANEAYSNCPAPNSAENPNVKTTETETFDVATNLAVSLKGMDIKLVEEKVVPDENIDPFDASLIDSLLEKMNFPSGHNAENCHFLPSKLPPLKLTSQLALGKSTYDVKKVLGEGAYAKVFRVQSQQTGVVKVLKYQKPAFPWEFYIANEIHSRCLKLNKNLASYFLHIEEGYFFENASLLVSSPVEYGDLLTAINLYKVNQGKPMSDFLALYFTVQILEIIENLHSFSIIHGDIKPDNFLVKKLNGKLALELIDFGRSIDMTLFPAGTSFMRVVTTDGFTCVEMQTGRPWTYQLDLYGVAGCVHCLLFGDYMKVIEKAGTWDVAKTIPRYLAKSGWKQLFQTLLNVPSCTDMPNLADLRRDLSAKLSAYGPQPDLLKLTNFLENR